MRIPQRPARAALWLFLAALPVLAARSAVAQAPTAADTARSATGGDTTRPATGPAPSPTPQTTAQATPGVRLTGVVYAQFEYWASDTLNHTNQFDVTRAYLNAIGSFGHGVGTRVTADVFRPGSAPSLDYRLKYAYFQWQPGGSAPLDFRFGMTQTPWIDWQEGLYGFRMQGTVPMERAGFLTSSDLGLAMDYATRDKALTGSVGIYNGEGYGNPPGGKFLDYEARASVRLVKSDDDGVAGGLRLSAYAGVGRIDSLAGGRPRNRFAGELSWKSKLLTLAGEAGWARTGQPPTTEPPITQRPDVKARVLSGFGVLSVPRSAVQLLARIDRLDPNTAADGDASTRFIGGIAYRIAPPLRVLGDVDAVHYEDATRVAPGTYAQRTRLLLQTEFVF